MSDIALHNQHLLYTKLRRTVGRAKLALKERADPRTQRTLEQLAYAAIVQGTTRLNQLEKFLLPLRTAKTAHHVETALSTALQKAKYSETEVCWLLPFILRFSRPLEYPLSETLMWAGPVQVRHVFADHPIQLLLAKDQSVIQALPPHTAEESFANRVCS